MGLRMELRELSNCLKGVQRHDMKSEKKMFYLCQNFAALHFSVYVRKLKDTEVVVQYELSQITVKPATYSWHAWTQADSHYFSSYCFLEINELKDKAFTLIQKNDAEFLLFSFKTQCVCECVCLALCYYSFTILMYFIPSVKNLILCF